MNSLTPFLKTKAFLRGMLYLIPATLIAGDCIAQTAKNPPIAVSSSPIPAVRESIVLPQWATEEDYTEPHLSGKWRGEMKKMITVLASWIQDAYPDPRECNPAWSGAYFSGKINPLPVLKYEMRAGFYIPSHTPGNSSHFVITVNDLSLLQESLVCHRTSYALLKPMKELDKGILYSETTDEKEDSAGFRVTRKWLVTYSGKLPFIFVSRREYLEEARKEIMTDKERVKEHLKQLIPMRSAQEQQAAKERDLQEIDNMYSGIVRTNRKRIYLESYKPDSVYFNETLSARSAPLDSAFSLMDSLLSRSSADSLGKPACISRPALSFRGFEDGQPGSRVLAKWNPSYFFTNVSPARPQFLVVTWQYDPSDGIAASIDSELMKKLDLRDLTQFLNSSPGSSAQPSQPGSSPSAK